MPQGEIIPQVLVFQEFTSTAPELTDPLRSFIAGPCYELFRNSVAAEKALGALGAYDSFSETCFPWPNRSAGAVVDQDFTQLFFDDALLKYFEDGLGIDETIEPVGTADPNKIRSDTLIWSTANGFSHSAVFEDRGVKVGDTINLRETGGATLRTSVVGFEADVIAAIVGTAAADPTNQAATIFADAINQTAGDTNQVSAVIDGSSYDGLVDGDVSETYFIEVIQGSVANDATTALLRITSSSGNDDVLSVAPAAFGLATAIGARGLDVTFDTSGSSSGGTGVDQDDFVVGQKFTATVTQLFTPVTFAEGGVYGGDADTTYIVEVVQGGLFADVPQVRVTTSTGVDSSGPHTVSSSGQVIAIGTDGVTLAFTGAGLNKGDKYTVAVVAEADGELRTILLGANLTGALLSASDLETKLYIKKDIEVEENREGAAPLVNFTTAETQICVQSGITAFDASWTISGVLAALPVDEGDMFVHYRALKAQFQTSVQTLEDVSTIESVLGPIVAENPLALGVFLASLNANGTKVKFMNVLSDDLAGHSEVINNILDRRDMHGLVPLTFDTAIQSLYQAHVNAASTAESATWRVLWTSSQASEVKAILTADSDGDPVLATIADDPDTVGTQFTIVTSPGALFQDATDPALPGDIVRTNYVDDGFGVLSFEEYVIDSVINNETIRLISGPAAAVTVASKFEVHRNLTKNEIAAELAIVSGGFGDRRVRNVWPDTVGVNGVDVPGYFLSCGLAGLRSGVVPQQGLTNVEIKGYDDLTRTTEFFNPTQLTTMAKAGTWIVTRSDEQALNPGAIFTRQQLTTDTSTIENGEDTFVSNPDSISFLFFKRLSNRIGRSNITPTLLDLLRTEALGVIEFLKTSGFNERIGGQINDGELIRLIQDPLLKDRVRAELALELPPPLNNLEFRILFS